MIGELKTWRFTINSLGESLFQPVEMEVFQTAGPQAVHLAVCQCLILPPQGQDAEGLVCTWTCCGLCAVNRGPGS